MDFVHPEYWWKLWSKQIHQEYCKPKTKSDAATIQGPANLSSCGRKPRSRVCLKTRGAPKIAAFNTNQKGFPRKTTSTHV